MIINIPPEKLKGFYITGTPSDLHFKNYLPKLKEVFVNSEICFALVQQIYKKGVCENGLPTLVLVSDLKVYDYNFVVKNMQSILLEIFQEININIIVLDCNDSRIKKIKSGWTVIDRLGTTKKQNIYFRFIYSKWFYIIIIIIIIIAIKWNNSRF